MIFTNMAKSIILSIIVTILLILMLLTKISKFTRMALKAFGKMQKRSLKEWLVYNEDTWNQT
jgi:competence protein ComGF